jgi:hypothetical protein
MDAGKWVETVMMIMNLMSVYQDERYCDMGINNMDVSCVHGPANFVLAQIHGPGERFSIKV